MVAQVGVFCVRWLIFSFFAKRSQPDGDHPVNIEMTPEPNPALHFFSDIRKIALIAFIAALLGLLIPVWRMTQQVAAVQLPVWARAPVILFGYLFSAIMPVFYFALYRNEGTLRFPKHLRQLSWITAMVFACLVHG
jgi:hypothetical protein